MILKRIKFWGILFVLFFLTGCEGNVPYDPELFRASRENCWPCEMYMQAFKAMDSVLNGSLETIAANSLIVLKMGLLFWLLFKSIPLLIGFSEPNMKKELASFVTVMFKATIVALFLNNPEYIYQVIGGVIIQPLGEGFLSLSKTVLDTPTEIGVNQIPFLNSNYLGNLLEEILRDFGVDTRGATGSSITTSRMFGGLAVSIYEIVFRIYAALWQGVGLGFQLWNLKGFSAAIAGIILIAGMFWLVVMMPLSFVDAFIRIGLMLLLLPLLMVGWVFSYPDGVVKKVFQNILVGFFDILFTCIYISFLITMFRVYESQEIPDMFSASTQTTEGGMRTIADNFGTEFLILTTLAWAMVKLSSKIQDFSAYFFGTAGKSGIFDTVNRLKNIAMKGVRFGMTLFSGPVGWAMGAAGVVKDSLKQAAQGQPGQIDISGNENNKNEADNKKDNSQKAAPKRSIPIKKSGGK